LKSSRHHQLITGALLAALFVRALVPEGFMPSQGEMVELCTLHGARMVMADPETGEILETGEQQSAPPCPWSIMLSALAAPSVPYLGVDAAPADAPLAISPSIPRDRASLALPPARAPPTPRFT
jgi:hypothetical protein